MEEVENIYANWFFIFHQLDHKNSKNIYATGGIIQNKNVILHIAGFRDLMSLVLHHMKRI